MTLEDLSKRLGVSKERARQIEVKALDKFCDRLMSDKVLKELFMKIAE